MSIKRARQRNTKRTVPPGAPTEIAPAPVAVSVPSPTPSRSAPPPHEPHDPSALLSSRVLESTQHLRGLFPAEVRAIHENLTDKLGHDSELAELAELAGLARER